MLNYHESFFVGEQSLNIQVCQYYYPVFQVKSTNYMFSVKIDTIPNQLNICVGFSELNTLE